MKTFMFSVLAAVCVIFSNAYAWPLFPTADQLKANYQICEKSDESWHRRWGQYLVSFDLDEATKLCQSPFSLMQPRLMACTSNGKTLYAGYYCEEISNALEND